MIFCGQRKPFSLFLAVLSGSSINKTKLGLRSRRAKLMPNSKQQWHSVCHKPNMICDLHFCAIPFTLLFDKTKQEFKVGVTNAV